MSDDNALRESLLRTTARLFQEKGYAAVTLRMIAAAAGVTTGSLYYYFSDKEEIVQEILDTGHKSIYEAVVLAIDELEIGADRVAKIRVAVRAHLAALFEPGSLPAANIRIYAHVPEHLRNAVRPGRRAYERFWIQLLSDNDSATAHIPPRHLAMFFFGAANWSFEWHRPKRESLEQLADDLVCLFAGEKASSRKPRRAAVVRESVPGKTQQKRRLAIPHLSQRNPIDSAA